MRKNKIISILFFSLFSIVSLWANDVTATVLNESGANTADGRIFLTITGGISPYSFSWKGPNGFTATSQDILNLSAGLYSVTVSDALCGTAILKDLEVKACQFQETHEITAVCGSNSGSAKISLKNGLPPYYYRWSNRPSLRYTNDEVIETSNLSVGNYSITVGDARGCKFTLPVSIRNAPAIGAYLLSSTPSCPNNPDGDIFTSTAGGTPPFKFSWSNGAKTQQLSYVLPGTYTLTVTDKENCQTVRSFNVGVSPPQIEPTTSPCGYISYCKGMPTVNGNYPLREQNDNGNCTIDHICTTTNQVVYTTNAPLYSQTGSKGCTIDYVCSISGDVMYSQEAPKVWQVECEECCTKDLICTSTGESLGYIACPKYLQFVEGIQCCNIIWIICSCTNRAAIYMREINCGQTPDCDGFTNTGSEFNNINRTFKGSDGYIYYIDPKTNKHHAFTFDEIASKKYKINYPNAPNIDINEKMLYNGDSVTIAAFLKPKNFSFSVNPNPFETNVTVLLSLTPESFDKTALLSVTNELGQIVGNYHYNDLRIGENELKPNFSGLNSGIYFISIRVKDRIETKKVYKK